MALKLYNNNTDNAPVNTTFSSISFSNPESKIMQSKFSISYFNRLMKISIALRNNAGSNDAYATYDTTNQVSVFVSNIKAQMLYSMINKLISDSDVHNVCIELKNGLLKVSDGLEYGSNSPCISISYADEAGNVNEIIYETKGEYHTAAYNYTDGKFSTQVFPTIEIETFAMSLQEYYKASSYAIAASVMEASMYKRQAQYDLIKSIADTVGAKPSGSNHKFNNKTFLSNNSQNNASSNYNGELNGIPKEYETASFDSIANDM